MTLRQLGDYTLFGLAVVVCIFTALYFFRSWYGKKKNRIGNIYLAKSIFLSMVLVQVSASVFYRSDYWNRDYIRLLVYGSGFLAYLVITWSLVREQNNDRAEVERLRVRAAELEAIITEAERNGVILAKDEGTTT